ncbi:hypothetical protein B0T26DRAFT_671886 [Lasiosphaeria miniovina]|uniref:Uncharacterized protein n=1 Tax=Lasiosphaeria miniovina TaxID=1954250 RepID=A0AA40E9D3_9PEZI|nr:uncharacterized protein B0T26DRAFT_671886 [Lasiosphaeria miniovina]KAK0727188.1 hypothetical protein B0T26DRAFT_671886 [Lasiosphaeria miniovina]
MSAAEERPRPPKRLFTGRLFGKSSQNLHTPDIDTMPETPICFSHTDDTGFSDGFKNGTTWRHPDAVIGGVLTQEDLDRQQRWNHDLELHYRTPSFSQTRREKKNRVTSGKLVDITSLAGTLTETSRGFFLRRTAPAVSAPIEIHADGDAASSTTMRRSTTDSSESSQEDDENNSFRSRLLYEKLLESLPDIESRKR